jgi:hypothetical protein
MQVLKKTASHGYWVVIVPLRSLIEIWCPNPTRVLPDNEATEPLWSPNTLNLE